jgi:hypothetical protein
VYKSFFCYNLNLFTKCFWKGCIALILSADTENIEAEEGEGGHYTVK